MKKGFTLIELIVTMIISSIVLYSLLVVFMTATSKSVDQEGLAVALSLAKSKLETVCNQSFVTIVDQSLTPFGADFSNFAGEVIVVYVTDTDLDTVVAGPTNYKKITVRVSSSTLPIGTIEIAGLVTNASN